MGKRGKRANKVATKRLKTAYKLLTAGKQNEFYDEVLRALWGYVGDKLNMPVEQLSRENISDQLAAHNINAEIIEKFISALDECEYERYAPGSAEGNMTKTYDSAMIAITEIDGVLRDKMVKRNSGDTVRIILLFVVLCFSGFVNASVDTAKSQQGDSSETAAAAYAKGDYQQAAECYTKLLKRRGERRTLL